MIIRFWNPLDKPGKAELKFKNPPAAAKLVNLAEKDQESAPPDVKKNAGM